MKILKNFKMVFIVGCQRTGTTLTGNILAAHPNVFMIDEPDGIYKWTESLFLNKDEAITTNLFIESCKLARLKYADPDSKCNSEGEISSQITHIVCKSPNLTFNANQISNYFPNKYTIFTYRDIRDVVVSMSKLDWIPMVQKQIDFIEAYPYVRELFKKDLLVLKHNSIQEHQSRAIIANIKTRLKDTFNLQNLRKIEVKYEDLTQNPDYWNRKILEHLDLPITDINYSRKLIGWGPGLTYRRNKVNTYSIGKWKEYLTPIQECDIWEICKDTMHELGYIRKTVNVNSESKWDSIRLTHKSTPIVATGRGGSGTRLLSELLQSMDVFLGNELGGMGDSIEWVNLLYKISIERTRKQHSQTNEQWKLSLQQTAADILLTAKLEDSRMWGWKLPETMSAMPEVFNAFPDAKLIHLIRHPVDSSLRRTHVTSRADNLMGRSVIKAAYDSLKWTDEKKENDKDYLKNAATWLYQVNEVVSFAKQNLTPNNYLEIKYEDLCENQSLVINNIANFLNIEVDTSMPKLEINKNRLRSWEYPDPRADEVWDICAEFAKTLGYKKIEF